MSCYTHANYKIEGFNAHCVAKGIERNVSLFLLQDEDIKEGDYLLIHVGYGIQKLMKLKH